ncbi:Tox-REase-5 domain-containing protein [Myxococcaceae bacterium GXIMD 01537]
MRPCAWVALLLVLLTGCATGAPVGHRVAAGGIRYRPATPRDSPDAKARAYTQKKQASLNGPGGGGSPAALVARATMGALPQMDVFEELLLYAGLAERDEWPVRGAPLTPPAAARLLATLLSKPVTLGNFPPRMAVGHLLREVLEGGEVSRDVLLRRVERFSRVAVLRPDGRLAWVRTGRTQQRAGPMEWVDGSFRAGPFELGRFYGSNGFVLRPTNERLEPIDGSVLVEVFDDADYLGRTLDGAEAAFVKLALSLGELLTRPLDSIAALKDLPAGVAALIASSPEYFERFRSMTRGEQVKAIAELATNLLVTTGSATATTRTVTKVLAGAEASVPVLSLSAQGALTMERVAVPLGRAAAVLGGGPGATIILHRANAAAGQSSPSGGPGPGQWAPSGEKGASPRARAYQEQISGHSYDEAYWVGGVDRNGGGVRFDGFKDGVLLEAKGPGYAEFFEDGLAPKYWYEQSGKAQELIDQAQRQRDAVRGMGIRVEWHVAEEHAANAIRKLLEGTGLDEIAVIHTPARPLAR